VTDFNAPCSARSPTILRQGRQAATIEGVFTGFHQGPIDVAIRDASGSARTPGFNKGGAFVAVGHPGFFAWNCVADRAGVDKLRGIKGRVGTGATSVAIDGAGAASMKPQASATVESIAGKSLILTSVNSLPAPSQATSCKTEVKTCTRRFLMQCFDKYHRQL
jgi:hypothetical protein